jgi:hypothetical protein
MNVPNVSVKVDIVNLVGSRLTSKDEAGAVDFDVKVKLEERERKSQMLVVGFALVLSTKPGIVKFEIEGTATLTGKDEEIRKMLEVDPEAKMPPVLQRIYQHAFTAAYLMSTILNAPPPPQDLLHPTVQGVGTEVVSAEAGAEEKDVEEGITIQADTSGSKGREEVAAASK